MDSTNPAPGAGSPRQPAPGYKPASRIRPQTCAYCGRLIKPYQRAYRSRPVAATFKDPAAYHEQGGGAPDGNCWAEHVRNLPPPPSETPGLRFGR